MEKKELLDLIDQDSSFMKAFLDEYRQDGVNFGAEDRLMIRYRNLYLTA